MTRSYPTLSINGREVKFDPGRTILEVVRNAKIPVPTLCFYKGTRWLLETLTRICQGRGQEGDLEFLEKLAANLTDASFCPLGQSAPIPLLSALRHFRAEIVEHLQEKNAGPGFALAADIGSPGREDDRWR